MALLARRRWPTLAPDVIGLQEVRDVPGRVPNQAAELARRFGWHHVFAPSTRVGRRPRRAGDRVAVPDRRARGAAAAAQRENEGRIILSARIDAATRARSGCTRRTCRTARPRGASARIRCWRSTQVVTAHANDNVQVVMGDFNAVPDSDEIRWLGGLTTLDGRRVAYQDAWARVHPGEARRATPGRAPTPYIDKMHWLRPIAAWTTSSSRQVRRDRRGTRPRGAHRVRRAARVAADGRAACSRRTTSASSPTCRWPWSRGGARATP